MGRYFVARIGQALLVLLGMTVVTFSLIHLTPGDPARTILGTRATQAQVLRLQAQLGLDRPLISQYLTFLHNAVTLNLGTSIVEHVSVGSLLAPRIGATLLLTAYASLISVVVAVPLAVISAARRNHLSDHGIRVVTMLAFAMPPFWLGLVLIIVFSVGLGWFPTSGYATGVAGVLRTLTLPALCLGLSLAPLVLRTLRVSMIAALQSEYVEAARARGYRRTRVLLRYALRNSLISAITIVGVNVGYLIGGVVVVENVFNIPGLGSLLVQSVTTQDFPVVEGLTLVFGAVVVATNLAADMTYAAIDPRVRL